MRRILILWLSYFIVAASSNASDADSTAILTTLKSTGIRVPYVSQTNFDYAPETVYDSVYTCLKRRSVEILAYDKADGILTWCDTSGSFVPLPTDASVDTLEQVDQLTATRSDGYTYGAALITQLANTNGLLSIFSMGRSPDVAEEAYSDGTYERELLNEVGRHLYKVSIGQAAVTPAAPRSRSKATNPATNYASAFRGRFRNVLDHFADSIRTNVQATPYSVPVNRLWASLLPVILQYDVVIDINPPEHKAIFAKRESIQDPAHPDTTKRADVLMVVLVEPASPESCLFYLAVLDQQTLLPTAVVGRGPHVNENRISLLENTPDFMKAAALVAKQLDQQIDTQMFYAERWGNKFLRRSGVTSPSRP